MPLLIQNIIFITVLISLTACNQVRPSNQNISASQTTNEVAAANLDLGIEYMKQGAYENALKNLEKAKKADPSYAPIYNVTGLLYQQLGDNKKAEDNFKRALSLNSNDSSTLNNYGNYLCQQNRLEEAEKTFLRAAANPLYESPEIAITNAGLCLSNNQREDDAEKYYKQALQLNPRIPQALIKMCERSFKLPNHLSARGYLQRYQQVARHTAKSLWLGIQIEQELGDKDAVSSYVLQLKNNYPDSKEAALLHESRIQ
ncbi:MAG: type IV pilus assembly protein PilF [Gammaproteobacteria bacterium]|jgi:type IV pilus assembly protein PilF